MTPINFRNLGISRLFADSFRLSTGALKLATVVESATQSIESVFRVTGLTSAAITDETQAIIPSPFQNIRSYRLRANKTSGATAGAVLKYVTDADIPALAEQQLNAAPVNPNTTPQTFKNLEDNIWSDWVDLNSADDLPGLISLYFQATADTWSVELETR